MEQWEDRSLVLGLGNPGAQYRDTRHNRGREVVQELARRRGGRLSHEECGARLAIFEDVVLAVPETFMNRSGYSARCLVERRSIQPERILVVYDDTALPLGTLRLRPRGGPGGQKGLASVLEALRRDDVPRLRLGIGPKQRQVRGEDLTDFVLSPFDAEEREAAQLQIERAADACESWLENGTELTMNRFNGPAPPSADGTAGVEEED